MEVNCVINLDKLLIVDCHNDTLMKVVDAQTYNPVVNINEPTTFAIDIPKMKQGKVNVAYFAAFCEGSETPDESQCKILAAIHALRVMEALNPNHWVIGKTKKNYEKGIEKNIPIGIPTIEGNYAIIKENLHGLIRQYRDLGVKVIAPVWNYSSAICDGTQEVFFDGTAGNGGFTELGATFVEEMNRHEICIDVSHMSEKSFWDVVQLTQRPIIASHSASSTLRPHVRNLTDDQLHAIAQLHGVVNVVFCKYFLAQENADVSTLVDHIEYIVNQIGPDYVGLGSDFDGATMPDGLDDISRMPAIVDEMEKRGFSYDTIEKILGKNNQRILDQCFKSERYHTQVELPIEVLRYENQYVLKISKSFADQNHNVGFEPQVKLLIDGYEIKAKVDDLTDTYRATYLLKTADLNNKLPYHVVTFEYYDANGKRYYATELLEFR